MALCAALLASLQGVTLGAVAERAAARTAGIESRSPLRLTDDTGAIVTLAHTPARIVSLAPGATEMLFAAGAGAKVVATVQYADAPPAAQRVPRIGDYQTIDLERLVRTRPDVVVVWPAGNNPAQLARIASLHLPIYRQQVRTLADLAPSLRRLGALAGTGAVAQQAASAIDQQLAALQRRFAHAAPISVLLQVWSHPLYTVGGGQLLTDVLRVCGAHNVFAELHDAAPAVTVEAVIARDPQVIVAAAPAAPAAAWLEEWRRFPRMAAVRDGQLLVFSDLRLTRLGPSVLPATSDLCALLERARAALRSRP